ncbi:MAG: type II secretion system protein GspM [Candidatus Contendobacter sp.]|nr:type II secretion system protein GspM [Candidatus Contendobacter sp.]MDG4556199.1 type II secretion system protein GspM [Candidatus Contendobacter sp.]
MKAWWESLSRRERFLIAGGAVLALALLLHALAWQPFQASHRRLRQSVAEQRAELAAMRRTVEAIRRLEESGKAPTVADDRSLLTLVDQTARTAGLGAALKRVAPQGENRLGVQFDAVEFDRLVPWLGMLERDHRVAIVNLSVDRVAAGRVNARATVQGRRP